MLGIPAHEESGDGWLRAPGRPEQVDAVDRRPETELRPDEAERRGGPQVSDRPLGVLELLDLATALLDETPSRCREVRIGLDEERHPMSRGGHRVSVRPVPRYG